MADEQARQDANSVPSMLGVSQTTGETRRVKTNNSGILLTESTGGGGSSASGGGLNTYTAKPSGTNADATVAYTSATTITVTGLSVAFTKYDIVSIRQIPNAGGDGTQDAVFSDVADFTVTGALGSQVITVANAAFAATDAFVVVFQLMPKGVDEAGDALKTTPQAAEWTRNASVETIFNALSTDSTAVKDVTGYKSVHLMAISSDTADLHASIDLLTSYDGGTTFVDFPGHFISLTRNMTYAWTVNVASATHIKFNLDEITATAGTVSLYMIKSFEDAPSFERGPIAYTLREAAVLTGSYVTGKEVAIEGFNMFSIISEFTTGATGATDTWLPNFQVEVSRTRTGDNWEYINGEAYSTGTSTMTRVTYSPNGNALYPVASTAHKDIVVSFSDNPGWKRARVGVRETLTPSNQGSMALYLTASNK